jgi:hypothetical protein
MACSSASLSLIQLLIIYLRRHDKPDGIYFPLGEKVTVIWLNFDPFPDLFIFEHFYTIIRQKMVIKSLK